jgi:hypothetical protein
VVDEVIAHRNAPHETWLAVEALRDAAFDHVLERLATDLKPTRHAQALRVLVRLGSRVCRKRKAEVLTVGRHGLTAPSVEVRDAAVAVILAELRPIATATPEAERSQLVEAVRGELQRAHEAGLSAAAVDYVAGIADDSSWYWRTPEPPTFDP